VFQLTLLTAACLLMACDESKTSRVTLGTSASFTETGDASQKNQVKCQITLGQHVGRRFTIGTATIDQLVLTLRIENLLPTESVVSIGPVHVVDQKGQKHDLILHTGRFYTNEAEEWADVAGPISGVPQAEITMKPNGKKLIPVGTAFPRDVEPVELFITVGKTNKKQIVFEFGKQTK